MGMELVKSADCFLTINADDVQDILNGANKEAVVYFITTGKHSFPCGSAWLSKTKKGIIIRINGESFDHPLMQKRRQEHEIKQIILYDDEAIKPQEEWR